LARRRSKWRKTALIMKKLMQEARKVRVRESLRQCPICGNPNSFSIEIEIDKESGRKSAHIMCTNCHFEYSMQNLPAIADEFWVYSKVLDMIQKESIKPVERVSQETVTVPSEEEAGEEEETEITIEEETV